MIERYWRRCVLCVQLCQDLLRFLQWETVAYSEGMLNTLLIEIQRDQAFLVRHKVLGPTGPSSPGTLPWLLACSDCMLQCINLGDSHK